MMTLRRVDAGPGERVAVSDRSPSRRPRPRRAPVADLRPVNPLDVAQARAFELLLLAEIAELEAQAAAIEARSHRLDPTGTRRVAPSEALSETRRRLRETRRMLHALQARFLSD